MSKKDDEKLKVDAPDITWLARLSDEEYSRAKARYADFIQFTFKQLMKAVVRLELYKQEEFAEALSIEVLKQSLMNRSRQTFAKRCAQS